MTIKAHLAELERQHKALEHEIAEALAHSSTDDLKITELKRRKLMLKDEIERLRSWEEGFAALTRFKEREGHCCVPTRHKEGALKLGAWVGVQRETKYAMSVERRQRLDAIGFVWDVLEATWEEGYAALTRFKEREGHCRVPTHHKEGALSLESWVSEQRTSSRRGAMSVERRQRLDAIGFVWDVREATWEEGLAALTSFKEREGHCRVPTHHKEGALKLGQWVGVQRKKKDTMPLERKQRLDAIGFVWDVLAATWEEGFAALTSFKEHEGHCNVRRGHIEGTFNLGTWVGNTRTTKDTVPLERKQRLDAIGFVWNSFESSWEEGFTALTRFEEREGHCNVRRGHIEGTFNLGAWVNYMRTTKDTMLLERKQRLDVIGFVWNPMEHAWEEGFAALTRFKERERHCNVRRRHIEGAFGLGKWVARQRNNRNTMPTERRQRLDGVGFVWRSE